MINFKRNNNEVLELLDKKKQSHEELYSEQFNKFNHCHGVESTSINGNRAYLIDDYYDIGDQNEVIFTTFNNKSIGKSVALSEESCLKVVGKHISYNIFNNCAFSNIVFEDCTFFGCTFNKCMSSTFFTFKNCSFSVPVSESNPNVHAESRNLNTIFNDFQGPINFEDCRMEEIIFDKCAIMLSSFKNSDMSKCIFNQCILYSLKVIGCDMRGMKIVNPSVKGFEFEDELIVSKFDKHTYLSKVIINDEDYDDSYEVYQTFSEQFRKNNYMDLYGEYFFMFKKNELYNLKGIEKISSAFAFLTFGYGERAINVLYTVFFITLITPFLFMVAGMEINGQYLYFRLATNSSDILPIRELLSYYGMLLEYCFGLLFNINFENIKPIGASKYIYYAVKISGFILVGLYIATLTRKMSR